MRPETFSTSWQAPSNIALVKYWGKYGRQLPKNPSLSISMQGALTTTRMEARLKPTPGVSVELWFEGSSNPQFAERISGYLKSITPELPFLNDYHFIFHSNNTFPHSTGIASSASSMAALALCIAEMEQVISGNSNIDNDFFRRASELARLASGSASRSVFGGWSLWGNAESVPESSDNYAIPVEFPEDSMFHNPGIAILIVSSSKKSLSSSMGHQLMDGHPYATARYQQAREHLKQLRKAVEKEDFSQFAEIVEREALTLHSLLMTSSEEGLLMKPASLKIIEEVRSFRKTTGTPVCFTLDAGPNLLLIYPETARKAVVAFVESKLAPLCEGGKWLDDKLGEGPKKLA